MVAAARADASSDAEQLVHLWCYPRAIQTLTKEPMLPTSRSQATVTPYTPNTAPGHRPAPDDVPPGWSSFPTRARFTDAAEAARYLNQSYLPGLHAFAATFESIHGRKPCDQDFPVELVRLVPPCPTAAPLLIVGGMGPLAGAQALQEAIERFGDQREIVLLQLCCVPDRTRALNADQDQGGRSDLHEQVVQVMAQGFSDAEAALESLHAGTAHVVVACNTAHNFAPEAFERYRAQRGHHAPLQLHSMVDCVVRALADAEQQPGEAIVILGTDGTLKTRLYIDPLRARNLTCAVPPPDAQQTLMEAIYKGVKAFNEVLVLERGEQLFRQMVQAGLLAPGQPFVVLAACTEVPEIVRTLKVGGSPEMRALLAQASVADPMGITQAHVARLDAGTPLGSGL